MWVGPGRQLWIILAPLVLAAGLATPAAAHPHVFVTAQATLVYQNGTFTGIRHRWTFDEFYSTMAIEGLDKNKDGIYDREELAELAKVNVDGLKEFSYFTFATLGGKELKLGDASGDYWLEHKDGLLTLVFTVPFASPVLAEAKGLRFSVYDPTYFIGFEWAKTDPVKLSDGAPANCKATLGPAKGEGGDTEALGGALAGQFGGGAVSYQKTVAVACSGP
jgi:ABC-type uncharacterized transport system substrate-binding protein